MTEKEIKHKFVKEYLDKFKEIINVPNIRLYSLEFPVKTDDGTKFVDMILEVEYEDKIKTNNPLIILEFKKGHINYGPIDQLNLYCNFVQKQLYRKKKCIGFLAAPSFSSWEIEECKRHKRFCLQYDLNGNMQIIK